MIRGFGRRRVGAHALLSALLCASPAVTIASDVADADAVDGPTPAAPAKPRPRIGLALGGGGAKGAAHVGVLGVLEELRIPIDCIVGTSMGALVGGTFASGMDAKELEKAVRSISWQEAIGRSTLRAKVPMRRKLAGNTYSNSLEFGVRDGRLMAPSGLINTQNVDLTIQYLVARSRGITDFDRLPIPYRAVATDMQTGEMVVLGKGDLALAMADNAQQKAFVTGEAVPLEAALALASSTVEVRFGGAVRDRASGAEVMGGPEHSIAWLANKLAEFDLALEAGMRVMSGSFTRQYRVERGDEVVAAFEPFGAVRARFD